MINVPIALSEIDTSLISRSQAKKLLRNLKKHNTVFLDFKKVELVGQGFADQVFRVYQNEHPEMELIPINMIETVNFMVNRAIAKYREEKATAGSNDLEEKKPEKQNKA